MKQQKHNSDEGLVLKKTQLRDHNQLVIIFSKENGKIVLTAFGVKKLTSRRLSHLETGNVINFSWREKDSHKTLQETDLRYAHSKIKENSDKLSQMFLLFFVLEKILPENEPEKEIYIKTLNYLKDLHSKEIYNKDSEKFLSDILEKLGFIDDKQKNAASFDPIQFVEGLIGKRIKI